MSSVLALAERVAALASAHGIATALIGANALAAHSYVRATLDVDLATYVPPFTVLRGFEETLRRDGLKTELRLPDEDDPLGGVLEVWEEEDDDGDPIRPVELVNFDNPRRPRPNPGKRAVENAFPLADGSALRCATLPDLIALKLYSGTRPDHADIVAVLQRNPDADVDAIRAAAKPYDRDDILETLLLESRAP